MSGRPLRGLERTMARLHDTMGPDVIIGRVEGPVSVPDLRQAAFALLARHPALRARIVGDSFEVRPPSIEDVTLDVVDPRDFADGIDRRPAWQQVAEACLRIRFEPGEVPCRFVIVPATRIDPTTHVMILAHHAVVDGTSLMRVLTDWLAAAASPSRTVSVRSAFPSAMDRFPRPWWLEPFVPLLRAVWAWDLGRWTKAPQLATRPLRPTENVSTVTCFRVGRPGASAALATACRDRGVTIGAAFVAATHLAVSRHRAAQGADPYGEAIPVDVEVNLRSRCDPPVGDDTVGFWVGGTRASATLTPDTRFWDLAKRLNAQVKRQIDWGVPAMVWWTMDGADPLSLLSAWGADPRRSGGTGALVDASNVGRWPHPTEYGAMRLREVFGMNGAALSGPSAIAWLRTIDGTMCFDCIGSAPTWTRAELEAFQDAIIRILERAAVEDLVVAAVLPSSASGIAVRA